MDARHDQMMVVLGPIPCSTAETVVVTAVTKNKTMTGSNQHLLAFAARGFINGLTDNQQIAFLQLFSSGHGDQEAMAAAIEQAEFEKKRGIDFVTDEALLAAVDYALPRQSAAVSTVCSQIETHWPELSTETQMAVQRRIHDAGIQGMRGMSMDKALWMHIASLPLTQKENIFASR